MSEKILGSGGGLGARESLERVVEQLRGVGSGALDGKAIVRVDGSAGAAATGTIAVTAASCTAGDKLVITVPGFPAHVLTAVAGAAAAADGEYTLGTVTNTAVAVSIVAAINAIPGLPDHVTASESPSGTVLVTADRAGTGGNSIGMAKVVTTAGAFSITAMSGGADPGQRPTATATFGTTNITNDDTVSIGSVTLTWKASASSESEITNSATETTAAANFAAKVNAHSALQGLVSASRVDAVVTVTWLGEPRTGQLIALSRVEASGTSLTWSASKFTPLTTESYGGTAPLIFPMGAP